MEFISSFFLSSLVVFTAVTALFFIALKKKDNSVLDVFWGLGFILVGVTSIIFSQNISRIGIIVFSMVTLWGSRLAYHIYKRNHGKGEDKRYQTFRKIWGTSFVLKSYLNLFLLQGLLLLIISISMINVIVFRNNDLTLLDTIGILIWIIGFLFEVIGDWQLRRFKNNLSNKGKILTEGLWRYTRHPNYFGEATMWWGIWLLGISTPIGIVTVISPILITILLVRISGVTMLEKHYEGDSAYEKYKQRTSSFFPWLPKN